MILYGYNVQAFRLPFTAQHSPSLLADYLNNYGPTTTARVQYGGQQRKALLLQVQHYKATNLHLLGAMAE